jgi:hypothetical protein
MLPFSVPLFIGLGGASGISSAESSILTANFDCETDIGYVSDFFHCSAT